MKLQVWWPFVASAFVIFAIPGPSLLLMMTHAARYGMRRCVATMAGSLCALVIMLSGSAAGLHVLLDAWPRVFGALRIAGGAYLVWLGVRSWRAKAGPVEARDQRGVAQAPVVKSATLFRNGFLVASSNPKAIVFAAAILPQFIDAGQPILPQFAVMLPTFAVIVVGWYAVYAGLGARIGEKLRSEGVARAFNRLTGGVFVGFGAMMALLRH
jgi:threonine/homoserine/homoserine lactone efflux protein